jgi:cob(I)alamin adenosyltransferase
VGNRLSRIYTRTGDDGSTGLGDGSRVGKDSLRVTAYGTVDELNSTIGMVLAADKIPAAVREALTQVQHDLFDLGGELCIPGMETVQDADVARLESILDDLNEPLPPLKEFILPGGGMAAACGHLARTVCRRAERAVVALSREEPIRVQPQHYLNRLSDLLFVICRVLARESGHGEVLWQHERRPKPKPAT